MFAVRGTLVCLSIFALLYSLLSLAVCGLWRRLAACGRRHAQQRCADFLFALRIVPFAVAAGVTLCLAVPSFLMLEPRATRESTGALPLELGMCGIAVILAGLWNATTAWMRASRMLAGWSRDATVICSTPLDAKRTVPVLRTFAGAPPLTAAGILRPTVWLSHEAERVLTARELRSALKHESMHVLRRDNLRKLLMRAVAFPGMSGLEKAWRETAEMAADDAAVASASEALDLASAVIKLSRLASLQPPGELTTALVHSPAESVNARVERLIAWKERQHREGTLSIGYALCAAAVAIASLAATYGALLIRMHAATEWLVR